MTLTPSGSTTPIDLSGQYNLAGIMANGAQYSSGGLDGAGNAFSANVLGTSQTISGVSYTIDSARHFKSLYPNDELFWVVGGDQLPQLHLWKDIGELVKIVEFIFLERPGYPVKAAQTIPGLRLHRCDGHLLAISSTELRDRTRRSLSLDYFVPHKAIVYIREKHLYRENR